MTVGVADTKGTGGITGAALFLLLLFATNQTAKAAETIPATVAGRPTPRLILFSDDNPQTCLPKPRWEIVPPQSMY
jgi:hypothetical protein